MRVFQHYPCEFNTEETYGQEEPSWPDSPTATFFGDITEEAATLTDSGGKSYQMRTAKITLTNFPPVGIRDYLTEKKHGSDWYVTGVMRGDNELIITAESYSAL